MESTISEILKQIKDNSVFKTISRLQYMPYKMNISLMIVQQIGRIRNPRFVIDADNRFTYENLIRWVHGDPEMKSLNPAKKSILSGRLNSGIYIAGGTGTGKSWALEIMSAYCSLDNVRFKIGKSILPLQWENFRCDAICDDFTSNGSLEKYKNLPIVGFQDLGAEPPESLYMGNRVSVLNQILECRGDHSNKITHITSNLPLNHHEFINRYGDRVASRLYEMCNYFELTGKDRRKP